MEKRLEKHNSGKSRSTYHGRPWELKKAVEFPNKHDAIRAEKWLKKMKSRDVMEKVIKGEIDIRNRFSE